MIAILAATETVPLLVNVWPALTLMFPADNMTVEPLLTVPAALKVCEFAKVTVEVFVKVVGPL